MYRLSLKLNLIIYTTNKKEKEKKKNAYHVNSAVNEPVQCTSKTPKLTLNAAPNLKCWSLFLLQMVTLFQAQAQPTMAATLFYRKWFLCLGLYCFIIIGKK